MYKPLSQMLTDEEDSDLDNLSISSAKVLYSPMNKPGILPADGCQMEPTVGEYRQYATVDMNGTNNNCHHSVNTGNPSPLTLARKIAFAISIFNCLALVIIFVWILPCDYDTCRAPPIKQNLQLNWEIKISGIVVEQMDFAVTAVPGKEILVASFHSDSFRNSSSCVEDICHGFVGLSPHQGSELWRNHLNFHSDWIDCRTVDVNEDGTRDCLAGSRERGLVALNPVSGSLLWQIHSHSMQNWTADQVNLGNVRPFADFDGDDVTDLVAIATNKETSSLYVISGRSGEIRFEESLNESQCIELISASMEKTEKKGYLTYECFLRDNSVYSANLTCEKCDSSDSVAVTPDGFHRNAAFISNNGVCPNCSAQLTVYVDSHKAAHEVFDNSYISPRVFLDEGVLGKPPSVVYQVLHWKNQTESGHYELEESVEKTEVQASGKSGGELVPSKILLRRKHSCHPDIKKCSGNRFPFAVYRNHFGYAVISAEILENLENLEHGTLIRKDVM